MDERNIDLAALTQKLRQAVPPHDREGLVLGKTAFRDAIAGELGCSLLEAEVLVDTLLSRGMIRYEEAGPSNGPPRWIFV